MHTQGIMSYIDSTGCHLHPTLPLNGNSVLDRIPWDYCHRRCDTLRRGILLTDPGDAWPFRYVGLADMLYPLNHRLAAHSLAVLTLFLVLLHCLMNLHAMSMCCSHYATLSSCSSYISYMTVTVLILCFTCILLAHAPSSSEGQSNCDWHRCLYCTHCSCCLCNQLFADCMLMRLHYPVGMLGVSLIELISWFVSIILT
jgi:hypothetical protein